MSSWMTNWRFWILATRPKTLTASVVPVLSTSAMTVALGYKLDLEIFWLILVSALLIQIGTNFINDAMDFKKGADTADRLGPKRVTQSGVFAAKSVLTTAYICLALAFVAGVPLVLRGGWPIVGIGVTSLFCAYAYTGGPYPLAYHGLGDLFVVLFFGILAVGGVSLLHTGIWLLPSLILGIQLGFLSTVLIAINNLRDVDGDRRANKRTLAVRFGKQFVRFEIAALLSITFILQIYWWSLGFRGMAILGECLIPFAVILCHRLFRTEPSVLYNKFLAQAGFLHLAFGLLISLGFLYDSSFSL